MKRRAFISLLGCAAAWPLAARAQQPERMRRVGVLIGVADDAEGQARLAAFKNGMQGLGWIDGGNVRMDVRFTTGNAARAQTYAAELVGAAPDVILGNTHSAVAALQQQTRTIPIVFVQVVDPVSGGFVESLARPGGNITGFVSLDYGFGVKWLEVLKEIAPQVRRAVLLFNPQTAPYVAEYYQRPFEAAAPSFGVEAIAVLVRQTGEIEAAIADLAREPGGGLVVPPDNFSYVHRELIFTLAARHRVPAVYPFRFMAREGGLVSYGVDLGETFPRAAEYIDRILKGTRPADLPVQAPTNFELVINLKTAKALGLDLPATVLARADEVIE
jgi:putative ABC transport system substrate-binding protein